jgi:hypothetical protein
MSDTTVAQTIQYVVSPTLGGYNQRLTWVLDSTTLLPTGVRHEITYPATVLPDKTAEV